MLIFLHDCLHGVAEKLSDDIFQMTEDIRKSGVHMALDGDGRYLGRLRALAHQILCNLSTSFDHLLRFALEEHFSHEIGVHIGSIV